MVNLYLNLKNLLDVKGPDFTRLVIPSIAFRYFKKIKVFGSILGCNGKTFELTLANFDSDWGNISLF